MTVATRLPIPVWVITGPLGVGKTTLIARLLASKPAEEDWVVLLNEFTDAGIDALTVAAAAQGAFDVRLVPGGCLCCTGEADFRRTLLELIQERRPARIIVEPSGIDHPVGIVEELLAHERRGDVHLEWVLGLLDGARLDALKAQDSSVAAAAMQIADAVVLTKSDAVTPETRQIFLDGVAGLYPPKRWTAAIDHGHLPEEFFVAMMDSSVTTRPKSPALALAPEPSSGHDHGQRPQRGSTLDDERVQVGEGERLSVHRLGRQGARWVFPRSVAFSRTRLIAALTAGEAPLGESAGRLERFKAVVRVSEDEWLLVQWANGAVSLQDTAWRRDNRLELQCAPGASWSAAAWDQLWLRCQVR